jgi:CHASE2 domain-containing sensor protein
MTSLIVLNFGKGDWQNGLPTVIAQLWDEQSANPMQFTGSLPPAPALDQRYQRWRSLYIALYSNLGWRRSRSPSFGFEIDESDVTNISQSEFHSLCQDLRGLLNSWLNAESFRNIDRQLRTHLSPKQSIRVIIVADDPTLLQLPWSLWSFLEDYPKAEIALSLPEYIRPVKTAVFQRKPKVRILAILGNSTGLDIATDQQLLQKLPNAELKFLVEPAASELNQQLWEPGWDVLFFAGHSSSQGKGRIQLNQRESLTVDQLKYGLRSAIAHGLKLAIFNSCDGLGLAQDLADLNLPQVIVMREPVPDQVAQEFLKHFLTAFSGGKSLYGSVRQAREKLQALETQFPCATWLPVICQNPAEIPPTWQDWCGKPLKQPLRLPTRREWQTVLLSGLVVTGLVTGARLLGWLQGVELWSYDRLMQSRPLEESDPRLLVVLITEQDMQAEKEKRRLGSISDQTLNRLLATLEQYKPQVIGLDLYRDFRTQEPTLAKRLKTSNRLVAICKRPHGKEDPDGVLPPPEVPSDRLGFSDFLQDPDGAVRRHLLLLSSNPTARCTTNYAFSVQLASRYLEAKGITSKITPQDELQMGNIVFRYLESRTGAYQSLVANSGQVLLNYRASPLGRKVAQQVTLTQVLAGQINPDTIKNRIILIGVETPHSSGDVWPTPYSPGNADLLPGVLIQAHMTSQILSAVLDQRPLMWVWPAWLEILWISGWALLGGFLGWQFQRLALFSLACGIAIALLYGTCWLLVLQGGWIPLLLPAVSLLMAGTSVRLMTPSSDVQKDLRIKP